MQPKTARAHGGAGPRRPHAWASNVNVPDGRTGTPTQSTRGSVRETQDWLAWLHFRPRAQERIQGTSFKCTYLAFFEVSH